MGVKVRQKVKGRGNPYWVFITHNGKRTSRQVGDKAAAESVDELGWFHPGDLGTMDDGGNIRLKGRIKDMIVRGGENIYATDMEGILYGYDKVKECQVVGYPDERLGEKTVACIIPEKPGEKINREEIVSFMADKAVKYLIPDMVVNFEDFPRTASGKVQKFKLRDLVIGKAEEKKG